MTLLKNFCLYRVLVALFMGALGSGLVSCQSASGTSPDESVPPPVDESGLPPFSQHPTTFSAHCSASKWCWSTPKPTGELMQGVWASNRNNVWTVGLSGQILHNNGKEWGLVESPVTLPLYAIWGSRDQGLWAAGQSVVLKYEEKQEKWKIFQWLEENAQDNYNLPPRVTVLTRFVVLEDHSLWAFGQKYVNNNNRQWVSQGVVYRLTDTGWQEEALPFVKDPNDPQFGTEMTAMAGRRADDVWVVGKHMLALHKTKNGWGQVSLSTVYNEDTKKTETDFYSDLFGVQVSDQGEVWVYADIGAPGWLHGTEGSWSYRAWDRANWLYRSYAGSFPGPDGSLWILSNAINTPSPGVKKISSFQAGALQWEEEFTTSSSSSLVVNHLYALSEKEAWVVGETQEVKLGLPRMSGPFPAAVFVENKQFQTALGSLPVFEGRSLWVDPQGGAAWAVGTKGSVWQYQKERGSWERVPTSTQGRMLAVWGSGPDDVWMAGEQGALLHVAKGVVQTSSLGSENLVSLWGASAKDVWVIDAKRTMYHYQGMSWEIDASIKLPKDSKSTLYKIDGAGGHLWLVGCIPGRWFLFHKEGNNTWEEIAIPPETKLQPWSDLSAAPDGSVWITLASDPFSTRSDSLLQYKAGTWAKVSLAAIPTAEGFCSGSCRVRATHEDVWLLESGPFARFAQLHTNGTFSVAPVGLDSFAVRDWWVSPSGKQAWAVDGLGVIQYEAP